MPKRVKITLYAILLLAIIAVVWLMFWQTNLKQALTDTNNTEILTWEDVIENIDTVDLELQNSTFEEDVMKDLEWFFNNNNGYEDIEWEYWFNNPENT